VFARTTHLLYLACAITRSRQVLEGDKSCRPENVTTDARRRRPKTHSSSHQSAAYQTEKPNTACVHLYLARRAVKYLPWLALPLPLTAPPHFRLCNTKTIIPFLSSHRVSTLPDLAHPLYYNSGQINPHNNGLRRRQAPPAGHKQRKWHHVELFMLTLVEGWHFQRRTEPRPVRCKQGWETEWLIMGVN